MKSQFIPLYLLFLIAFLLVSNSSNPPDGRTGAPGEDTCTSCHGGNNANGFEGILEIQGLPAAISPNETYSIAVVTKRTAGMPARAGFQLVAVDENNTTIGTLANPSASATIKSSGGKSYFEHNPALKFEEQEEVNWTVDWTAPATVDAGITFYATAILGDGSGSAGDAQLSATASGIVQSAVSDIPPITAIVTATNASCFGENDGSVIIETEGGIAPYTYKWSNDRTEATINDFEAGTYSVTISDATGVTSAIDVKIDQPTELIIEIVSTTNIDCNNKVGLATVAAAGGLSDYQYNWAGMEGASVSLPVGEHVVTVTDGNGCKQIASVIIDKDVLLPNLNAGPSKHIDCQSTTTKLEGSAQGGGDICYLWTSFDGRILSGDTTLTPTVDSAGTYTLIVSNKRTGCSASSQTEVTASFEPPMADAGPTKELSCAEDEIQLDGTNSSIGDVFTYRWTNGDSPIRNETTLNPSVSQKGLYTLTVRNTFNGCSSAATVNVIQDINMPTSVAGEAQELDCTTNKLTLNGNGSVGIDYVYLWETEDGIIESGETTLNPTVIAAGTYTLIVRNRTNNCDVSSSVIISEGTPIIANAGLDKDLSCNEGSIITLDGRESSTGPNIVYAWSTEDGNILSVNTASIASIDAPGTYILTVKDTVTSCVVTDTVVITQINKPPVVMILEPTTLSCEMPTIMLEATVLCADNVSIQWVTDDGNIVSGKRTLTPTINAPGTYEVGVFNIDNGCVATASVTVTAADGMPVVRIAPVTEMLDCTNSMLRLNGTASKTENGFTFAWTTDTGNILEGDNTLSPTINREGTYTLIITNLSNNCTSADSITIIQAASPPVIVFEEPAQLDCINTTVRLTTKEVDASLNYEWTTTTGRIVEGQNTPTPSVDAPGDYTLLLTDVENNCESSETIQVLQNETGIAVKITTSETLDCNTASISLTTNVEGGGAVSYLWCTETGNIISGVDGPSPIIDMPGVYDVVVTDGATSCIGRDTIIVEPAPSLRIKNDTVNGNSATVIVSGGVIPYSYKWSTNPVQTSVTANNLEDGAYTVTITDANGCSIEKNIGVGIIISTADITSITSFEVYPNPVGDLLRLQASFEWREKGQAIIRNSIGKKIWEQSFDSQELQLNIATNNWPSGIYFLVLQTAEGMKTEQIVVKN